TLHGQHYAGGHAQGVRRSRRGRRDLLAGRRRLRENSDQLRQGRYRRRCARHPPPGRGRGVLRQVLERSDGLHRVQERRDPQRELKERSVASRLQKTASASQKKPPTELSALRRRPAWTALEKHYRKMAGVHLRQLFAEDASRGERLAFEAAGIYLDYSKNRVTDETLKLLLQLAEESGLREHVDAMFRGERINVTENRAVLHVALRAPRGAIIAVDGENVVPQVHAVLDKMADFSNRVRSGVWK